MCVFMGIVVGVRKYEAILVNRRYVPRLLEKIFL